VKKDIALPKCSQRLFQRRRVFVFLVVVSVSIAAHVSSVSAQQKTDDARRYFTVSDSIEMDRFSDGIPIFSPDGKYCAVVTSKGVLRTNEVESSVRIFLANDIKKALNSGGPPPSFTLAAKLDATPTIFYEGLYEPVISDLRWTSDSKRLLFLGQNAAGNRQLYEAILQGGAVTALTAASQDVSQFDAGGDTIVYRVSERERNRVLGDAINADAYDITGLDISQVLFEQREIRPRHSTLWYRRHRTNHPVLDPATHMPLILINDPPIIWNTLSVAPDGRSVVVLSPVPRVEALWSHYEPKYAASVITGRIKVGDERLTVAPRLTQYAKLDLATGQLTPLVGAPDGYALGYGNENYARWSSDGRQIVVVNTFLPVENVDAAEKGRRAHPCSAAVIGLDGLVARCVVYRSELPVQRASFGQTANEVVIQFLRDPAIYKFRFANGTWQPEAPTPKEPSERADSCDLSAERVAGVKVEIVEDLNVPPMLSATDCDTAKHKTIWDPNPRLGEMKLGEASIIEWKDSTGYHWKGRLVTPPEVIAGHRYPLVIEPYGFDEHIFVTDGGHTTAWATRPLAAAGIVVVELWPRQDHILTEDETRDQIAGFQSVIGKLVSEGLVDPERVGIIGFSRTCYYALSAILEDSPRFAAATLADGVNQSYVQSLFFPWTEKETDAIYGTKPIGKGLRTWVDKAPGFRLDRIGAPVRIEAIGASSVLLEWEIYASLRAQNKPVEFIYIPDGQHTLQKPLDRMASQQGNVDWFRFWLQDYEDPDPAKAAQYKLWRGLRDLRDKSSQKPH
jgi:dipeptidyl aminopeptidase/acylaminoacyl peptidase